MLGTTSTPAGGTSEPPRNRRWWLAYHVAVAPFGILATTWLLAGLTDARYWTIWKHLGAAADLIELGAVVYVALAVLLEGGGRVVFWAIEQWRKDREKRTIEAQNRTIEAQNRVLDELVDLARQQPESDVATLVDAVRPQQGRQFRQK